MIRIWEGYEVNDRAVSLLEQYDIEVIRTRKGRGAILCDTNQGCLIFKEYKGNAERIAVQDRLLRQINSCGKIRAESIIPSREEQLLVKDNDGTSYVLKTWFEGRECNIYDRNECVEAVRVLAGLHNCMELHSCIGLHNCMERQENVVSSPDSKGCEVPEDCVVPEGCDVLKNITEGDRKSAGGRSISLAEEFEKHNRELRKVRRFLRQKGQKCNFEICLQNHFDAFLHQAEDVSRKWQDYVGQMEEPVCETGYYHGDYQYHNIIKNEGEWCVVNFEHCAQGEPVKDLYLLLRKLLEKSSWSVMLGKELINAYDAIRPMSAYTRTQLAYRLAYPEKFWKIVNFYYNSGKAWIPGKNLEKLLKLLDQEAEKQKFLAEVFE